jgi:eukaryotic-like serine/threonine-protein kinase
MRERKVPSAAAIRRLRRFRPVDLASFGARPTRRAGEFLGGRYRIEGLLDTGGTANVYLAVDTRVGHSVVVKQLNRDGASNDDIRARFFVEAEALSNFVHPRIMRVLDFATSGDDLPYLVTEALVGETLAALLRRRPLLPTHITLMIARQTVQGLVAAHRRGLVHRDIKPGNLFLLGPRGAPFGLKIIDFGMAKLAQSNDTSGVHTVLGTIDYMAPEQVMADSADGRTDVYGFGIVLFRLLTGRLPFHAEERIELLCHQLFSPVPSPSWFDSMIDPRMDALITRATRKHPDNRYPNMRAMLSDLDVVCGLCKSEPIASYLVVEPDRYVPQNEKGREVAALLAERYAAFAPSSGALSERDAAYALTHPRTLAPQGLQVEEPETEAPESAEFEDLAADDLEVSEG